MEELPYLPERPTKAYEALGNAVNVDVAELVAKALLEGAGRQRSLPLVVAGYEFRMR